MSDPKDMGPFADLDPQLVHAISSYGTPPYRKTVKVTVCDIGYSSFDEMPTTIPGWMEWLTTVRDEAPPEYRDQLACVLHWESGYYDSGDSANLSVWYERPETDAEMTARVNRGLAYIRESATSEREQYERLKAKFG